MSLIDGAEHCFIQYRNDKMVYLRLDGDVVVMKSEFPQYSEYTCIVWESVAVRPLLWVGLQVCVLKFGGRV